MKNRISNNTFYFYCTFRTRTGALQSHAPSASRKSRDGEQNPLDNSGKNKMKMKSTNEYIDIGILVFQIIHIYTHTAATCIVRSNCIWGFTLYCNHSPLHMHDHPSYTLKITSSSSSYSYRSNVTM